MELEDHENQMDAFEVAFKPKRSVLLIVLCSLTWFYSALVLGRVVLAIFQNGSNAFQFWGTGIEFWLIYILNPILCSVGAIFMLNQKKIGFWIYLSGQIPAIAYKMYMIVVATATLGPGMFFGFLVNLIPIAFIILYATQLFKRQQQKIDLNF